MRVPHKHPYQSAAGFGFLALAIPLLLTVSTGRLHVPFDAVVFSNLHTLVAILTIVLSLLVFVTGYVAIFPQRKGAVVILGVSFLGVGLLDLLHTMAYVGMRSADPANNLQQSTFFWLIARLLGASSLLTYVLLPEGPEVAVWKKRLSVGFTLLIVTTVGIVGFHQPHYLPSLLDQTSRPTPLTTALEYLVIGVLLCTLATLWFRQRALIHECVMALAFAAGMGVASELFFTMRGVTGIDEASMFGNLFKLVAFMFLFHAVFHEAVRRPLDRMQVQRGREVATLSATPDGVLWVNQTGHIVMANNAIEGLTGYRPDELVGQHVNVFLPPHLRQAHVKAIQGYFLSPEPRAMGLMELNLVRRDGKLVHVDISLGHWSDEGELHAIAYIRDLSERKKFEESLRYQATHDELTGLPNRWLFRLQLDQALARSARMGQRVAVLFLDLDYFKNVNDSFGHSVGDALLKQVSARIRSALRENDALARLGGDEFAVLLTDIGHVDEAIIVAAKLLRSLQTAYRLEQNDIYSGGSLGLAFYPDDAHNSDTLLRYADMAMYQAKQEGRGTYACYSREMDARVHEDMQIHTRLKEALEQGLLELYFQPQVDVQGGEIVGVEALLRWNDPVLGQVPPSRFVPVAEATGLILPLSSWVLDAACRQIAEWSKAGTPVKVAVNFSGHQFSQRDLPLLVATTLERSKALAQWLEVEITESVAMKQPELAAEQLHSLVALGCSIALDDFGTGYSSLASLKSLPVSTLKIDRGFMQGIPLDANDAAISSAIIALAHSLGLKLVAEGVETAEQLNFLQRSGCETYQGWLFAKALPVQDMTDLLVAQRKIYLLESDLSKLEFS